MWNLKRFLNITDYSWSRYRIYNINWKFINVWFVNFSRSSYSFESLMKHTPSFTKLPNNWYFYRNGPEYSTHKTDNLKSPGEW
jgi:hypothetical protein